MAPLDKTVASLPPPSINSHTLALAKAKSKQGHPIDALSKYDLIFYFIFKDVISWLTGLKKNPGIEERRLNYVHNISTFGCQESGITYYLTST